ncbi:MAG TPA: thioredoxin [bacterium]
MEKQPMPKSFDDLIRQSEVPVLADFWAEWCGACKMMAPTIDRIASAFKGQLTVVKINVDQKGELATEYQIMAIPTLMLFHRGKVLLRKTGALPFEALKTEIASLLAVKSA